MNVALIGSVSSSHTALNALISSGVDISCVLGLDESRSTKVSDYKSLRPLAEATGLPFLSFTKVNNPNVTRFLNEHPPDLLWCIGLSQLIPDDLLSVARHGGIGFHPTMLPKGRGRAPIAWTILLGERAAVNLFFLANEADAGDIIVQREVPVLPDDYSEDLISRMNRVLHDVIIELAPSIKSGALPRTPQDHSQASYYLKRTPADGLLDWSKSTDESYRLIRAAGRPYPGAFTYQGKNKVKIWRAVPAAVDVHMTDLSDALPGTIIHMNPKSEAFIRTSDSAMRLQEIEYEPPDAVAGLAVGCRFTNKPVEKDN